MNTIQSGSVQVNEPISMKNLSIRNNSALTEQRIESGRPERDSKLEGKSFDLSKLREEDQAMFEEELQKHNEQFAYTGKVLKFRYDEEAETSYVEVINSATNEVIVTLPPEFLIDLSVKMKEIIGMFIDEKL